MKVLHVVKTAAGAAWAYHQVRVLCSLGIKTRPCASPCPRPQVYLPGHAILRRLSVLSDLLQPAVGSEGRKEQKPPTTLDPIRERAVERRADQLDQRIANS
jgi:hypothetical protein